MSNQQTHNLAGGGPAAPGAPARARRAASADRGRPGWRRWVVALLVVLLLSALGFAAALGLTGWGVMTHIYKPLPSPPPEQNAVAPQGAPQPTPAPGEPTWTAEPTTTTDAPEEALPPGRINILVLGTDKRSELGGDAARSDTLILLSVDRDWKTAGILSIPRDLQVSLPGYGLQKINAAYFFGEYNKIPGGGPALAVPTVRKYFNVPIQYYVAINFDGFQKVVDEVGGIDVNVPEPIDDPEYPGPYNSYIHVKFAAGCQHMNGERALQYARTRHADSDFGRARRQQQVIRAVREKALDLNMLPRYSSLLNDLGNAVETNIPPEQQLAFAQLAGQIKSTDIYTAQIDSTMVTQVAGNGNLELRRDKAKPMLDWFFGRGPYAKLRPGTILTPEPTATGAEASARASKTAPDAVATSAPARAETAGPAQAASPGADSSSAPPEGRCQ
jgi:polyisoprenyl-teichoic acid--peptidoglycan teichoic acid transferase